MAVISKGITLSYKEGTGEGTFIPLTNLQEIPDLGGEVEAIEITTLADSAHKYTKGLKSYGDSLDFKFLFEVSQFEALLAMEDTCTWQVSLPEGMACSFEGTSSVKLDGVGVNAALTYTLSIKPSSEMIWA